MSAVPYHAGRFPPSALNWQELLPLIGPANAAIARYDGALQSVLGSDILLAPLTTQEAVLSSRIEGTQATLGEVLEFEAEGDLADESTPKKADIHEVLNYRKALREAARLLETLPLSQRLVREVHKVLMQGVRGHNKAPGDYRRVPNWIGPANCNIEQARFIPASADILPQAMNDWEMYLNSDALDRLVQLAIVHAEFEAIHPFLDGNGRLGRLIIPIFLFSHRLLARPNFYLSAYFERNRNEYYDRLLAVSRDGDWTGWCAFFLRGVILQAEENQSKAQEILALYRELKDWIVGATHSQFAVRSLDWMFAHPIFRTSHFFSDCGIPRPTATRILREVRAKGLLNEVRPASGRRAATLAFPRLLNIAEGRDAF